MNQPVNMNTLLPDLLGAKGILNAPPQIALDALRKTAIDFCNQSGVWEYRAGFDLQPDVRDYPLEVLQGTRVAYVKEVKINDRVLASTAFWMEGRDVLWLRHVPPPTTSYLEFCVALKPSQDACELPAFLAEDWLDALTAGAAFRLFSIPKQDWSNSGMAMMNNREYSRWLARARQSVMQNYKGSSAMMTGSYF